MTPIAKLWHLRPHDAGAIARLGSAMNVSPIIAQLLLNRRIEQPEAGQRFLDSPLSGLHAPGLLPGLNEACERIGAAIAAKKRICIYGDYDVDGVTGTTILLGLLHRLGANVEFYLPHRLEEGYGLNVAALRHRRADGVDLVVSVDCGIASLEEAREAKKIGLELIVTDHHEMKDELPEAVLVHPRIPGSSYPFGGLSGAGVAFKLAWALAMKSSGSEKVTQPLREFLLDAVAFAALGLVADVVPLQDENRILVKHGLARLKTQPPLGMKALIEAAGLPADAALRAEDVAFKLAPRMNAAGRLGYAGLVVEMLTTASAEKAREVAQYLESQNAQRQHLERKMTLQAKILLEGQDLSTMSAAVLVHPEWHAGVIGIVASRMVEYLGRPVLIIAQKEGSPIATGSGRSIPGFALHEALRACDSELLGHGGHAMAAGFKVALDRIAALRERFSRYAADHFPKGVPPAPRLVLDAEVPLSTLTLGLLKDLDRLEPYGADNPRPRFLAGGLRVDDPRRMGQGERHMSFRVKQGATSMRAVAFGMGERLDELTSAGGQCCVAFTPKLNEWMGQKKVELEIADFQAGAVARLV